MFIVRWAFRLLALTAVLWFAFTVPLGKRTLAGHLRAIFSTTAAQDLASGAQQGAGKLAHEMKEKLGEAKKPLERVSDEDRQALDRLIDKKTGQQP